MDESTYKNHFELLDRYQAFSAEVLRLSLATIAAFGFFLGLEHGEGNRIGQNMVREPVSRWTVGCGLAALVIALSFALMHRYCSSDAMFYILRSNQKPLSAEDKAAEHKLFHTSTFLIASAPVLLAAGVILLAGAFLYSW